jgi:serine/threonine protein kinase
MDQPGATQPQREVQDSPLAGESFVPLSLAAGTVNSPIVPDYELLRRIGGGAYGDVWLARSKATGALRAAKIVWRNRFEDDRPFRREFEGIQRFEQISREHPSQLALFHIGRNDVEGYFYYVMELADDVQVRGPKSKVQSPKPNGGNERTLNLEPSTLDSQGYSPHTLRADLEHGPFRPCASWKSDSL